MTASRSPGLTVADRLTALWGQLRKAGIDSRDKAVYNVCKVNNIFKGHNTATAVLRPFLLCAKGGKSNKEGYHYGSEKRAGIPYSGAS